MNERPCASFAGHLRDAIRLNRERLPRYAELTAGHSVPISRSLIRAERAAIPLALLVDAAAARHRRRGLRVGCDEWEPMERTPSFAAAAPAVPAGATPFRERRGRPVARRIAAALRGDGFAGAEQAAQRELEALAGKPEHHCMLRHLLESAVRVAALAPLHVRDAERLGVVSPVGWSRRLLRLHLLGLPLATRLDTRAAPLQAAGVPILCRDVPPISPLPGGGGR